jgi:hypothetical protein
MEAHNGPRGRSLHQLVFFLGALKSHREQAILLIDKNLSRALLDLEKFCARAVSPLTSRRESFLYVQNHKNYTALKTH